MNYQEIVNRIQDITNKHKMLADFGYGDLSDLKVRFENTSGDQAVQADYPYLFLNPGVHGRNQGVVTYNFNMIVMDMARGEVSDQPYNNMLAIQSQCQQYIDDVIAYLHDAFKDNPDVIYSGVTYTPFNERFQDEVSGMTATLTIEVPQPINNCVTPFPQDPVLVLNVNSTADQLFRPDEGASPQKYQSITLDTYNAMRPLPIANYYSIQTPTPGSWVFTETGQAKKALGADPFTNPRVLLVQGYSGAPIVVEPIISTFPTDSPINEVFNYTCTWEVELDPTQVNYVAFSDSNEPVTEPQYWTLAGVNLKGTYLPTI
jgi:hypothetical protein